MAEVAVPCRCIMHEHLIELENVQRYYDVGDQQVRALDGVTFNVDAGEFIAVMGSSGSGKSSLVNVLGCLRSLRIGRGRCFEVEPWRARRRAQSNAGLRLPEFQLARAYERARECGASFSLRWGRRK